VRSFTLDTDAPLTAPTLIAPVANASATTPRPTFQWSAVAGAVRYEIRYGTQPNLSAITPIGVSSVTHVPTGDLPLTNIYWEVRAIDGAGNIGPVRAIDGAGNIGPYSAQRIVKITSAVGTAPGLWGYSDNTPQLTWTALTWPASYTLEVSRNTTFTDIVWQSSTIPASTSQVDVGLSLTNGTYYWRVRGQYPAASGGAPGPWSTVSSFVVAVP
jgi:hypothetical protein